MNLRLPATSAFTALLILATTLPAGAQVRDSYPERAPLDEYFMTRTAEVAMARSAAPESISNAAEILFLGRQRYETASHGKNGFVCLVQRSWTAGSDDPEFWNPKLRAPICYNPAAARSYLPVVLKRTEWVLAGISKTQMFERVRDARKKREVPALEPGAMCYMLSKQGYLNDRSGHWHPHLMFFVPKSDPTSWGANLQGSPLIGFSDDADGVTTYLVAVSKWSDGTSGPTMEERK